MKKLLIALALVVSAVAQAGGGSSIGTGSPKIYFGCTDVGGKSIYAQIYTSPEDDYSQLHLGITDFSNDQSRAIYLGVANDLSDSAPGSARFFVSGAYRLSVSTGNAPLIDSEGIAHFPGSLTNISPTPMPVQPLIMDCKSY
jgi:hypothetical protein